MRKRIAIAVSALLSACGGPVDESSSSAESSSVSSVSSIIQSSSSFSSSSVVSHSSVSSVVPYTGEICSNQVTYGARQLKLLSRNELQNSLEDLVGISFDVRGDIPSDAVIHGYANNIASGVTEVHADSYMTVAERVASWSREQNFAGVVNCAGLDAEGCAQAFIEDFALRAFRRPAHAQEAAILRSLFAPAYTDGDIAKGVELAMATVLTSPAFLYRSEQGDPVSVGEFDGSQYLPVDGGDSTRTFAADFGRKDHGVTAASTGAWTLRSKDNQTPLLEQHFALPNGGTLLEIEIKGEIVAGVVPEVAISIQGETHTRPIDSSEYQRIKLYFPDTSGHHPVRIQLSNARSAAGDASSITVRAVNLTQGTLPDNAADADAYKLNAYEVASYLSYTFTGSTPDANLLAAAANGELETETQIANQIERLLGTSRAKAQLGEFVEQWLGLKGLATAAKDPAKYPELTDQVRQAMAQEVEEVFSHMVLNPEVPFSHFFNADYTFVNDVLSSYYQLSGTNNSGQFTQVNGQGQRGGILTTGAFLTTYGDADESSPIHRAANIRERLLCQHIAPPPPGIAIDRDNAAMALGDAWESGDITNRERYAALTVAPSCAACHKEIINPLGFGLEDFDTIGRYRDTDLNGNTINAQGTLYGINQVNDGQAQSFYGAKGLSEILANTHSTHSCVVQNAFRFVVGSGHTKIDDLNPSLGELDEEELRDYACTVNDLSALLTETGDLKAVFRELGTLKLIRYRKEKNR